MKAGVFDGNLAEYLVLDADEVALVLVGIVGLKVYES